MRRHWQKRPLLIRGAVGGAFPFLSRERLVALARAADVESRLVSRTEWGRWTLIHGPFPRRALPPRTQPRWTLLVQGVDLHGESARELLDEFRFVPDARLDDVMVSFASDGGGVGPHVDSYDVFLLRRTDAARWRIARRFDPALRRDAPLKVLRRFAARAGASARRRRHALSTPGWAHDGAAEAATA